jgi:hypothetical protein
MTPTDQELNIAVAKVCGWKRVSVHTWTKGIRTPKEWISSEDLPDYGADLNAMSVAIETLPSNGCWGQFNRHLANICGVTYPGTSSDTFLLINATAAHRREAFLITLNLYPYRVNWFDCEQADGDE